MTITASIYPNACEYIDRGFFCELENALIYARKALKEDAPQGFALIAFGEWNLDMSLPEIEEALADFETFKANLK